jgi:hypothetical protein
MRHVLLRRVGHWYEARPDDARVIQKALRNGCFTGFPAGDAAAWSERLEQAGLTVELIERPGTSPLPSAGDIDARIAEGGALLPRLRVGWTAPE